jgi:hypothetical protein
MKRPSSELGPHRPGMTATRTGQAVPATTVSMVPRPTCPVLTQESRGRAHEDLYD